jgi:uncharacterized Tic20 family protein
MPHSPPPPRDPDDRPLAILAESLFVANLTIAPGLAFVLLAWLWATRRESVAALARSHLIQSFHASLRGGLLLLAACLLVIALGGAHWPWTWVLVIVYFTCIHSTLLICGCLALARAMAGKHYCYPMLGVSGA